MVFNRWDRSATLFCFGGDANEFGANDLSNFACIYAIGDIHGRLDLLVELETKIRDDAAVHSAGPNLICYLGDYVDRGPDSAGVLRHLCTPANDGFARVFLKGNHEQRMLEFMLDPRSGPYWAKTGGSETLASFGIEIDDSFTETEWRQTRHQLIGALTAEQLRFLLGLDLTFLWHDHLFVHAGIRPGVALEQQEPDDLMNIREPFSSSIADHGFRVVHGHDSHCEPEIRKNRINIDTKAWTTGRLTCAVITKAGLSLLTTGY